jgi:hypothetical protein
MDSRVRTEVGDLSKTLGTHQQECTNAFESTTRLTSERSEKQQMEMTALDRKLERQAETLNETLKNAGKLSRIFVLSHFTAV